MATAGAAGMCSCSNAGAVAAIAYVLSTTVDERLATKPAHRSAATLILAAAGYTCATVAVLSSTAKSFQQVRPPPPPPLAAPPRGGTGGLLALASGQQETGFNASGKKAGWAPS